MPLPHSSSSIDLPFRKFSLHCTIHVVAAGVTGWWRESHSEQAVTRQIRPLLPPYGSGGSHKTEGIRPANNRLAARLRQYPLDPLQVMLKEAYRRLRSRDSQSVSFGTVARVGRGRDWRPGSAAQSTGSPLKLVQSGGGDRCRLDQEPGGSLFAKRWSLGHAFGPDCGQDSG